MSVSLPHEFNYDTPESLPGQITNREIQLLAVNGASFSCAQAGTVIQYMLPSTGFLVPDSLYIRYDYTLTNSTAAAFESVFLGCPVYAPIQRLQTILGSNVCESINNYNVVQHMLSNTNLDVASKWGMQQQYGYANSSSANYQVANLQSLNGGVVNIAAGGSTSGSMSAFLPCLLSNAQKLVPLCAMPSTMIQLTLDSITNIFGAANALIAQSTNGSGVLAQTITAPPSTFTLTNVVLTYNVITPSESITQQLIKESKLYIKSSSFANIQNFVPQGSNGQIELIFNTRLASVKSAFLLSSSTSYNGIFDSVDPTSKGDFSFIVNGQAYPPRPIVFSDILCQLRKTMGSMGSNRNTLSIDNLEMSYMASGTIVPTAQAPAKFYPSYNFSTTPFNSALLNGLSTQNSPISVRMNIIAATARSITCSLVLYYDAIIEIDTVNRNASVKQ